MFRTLSWIYIVRGPAKWCRGLTAYLMDMLGEGEQATVKTLDVDVPDIVQQMEKDYNELYMKEFLEDVKNHLTFAQ